MASFQSCSIGEESRTVMAVSIAVNGYPRQCIIFLHIETEVRINRQEADQLVDPNNDRGRSFCSVTNSVLGIVFPLSITSLKSSRPRGWPSSAVLPNMSVPYSGTGESATCCFPLRLERRNWYPPKFNSRTRYTHPLNTTAGAMRCPVTSSLQRPDYSTRVPDKILGMPRNSHTSSHQADQHDIAFVNLRCRSADMLRQSLR